LLDDPLYPRSLDGLDGWARRHRTSLDEARKRFAQFVILDLIGRSPRIRTLAFKGGNALRFLHQSPRSTVDLDFTAPADFPDDEPSIRALLDDAFAHGAELYGLKVKTQSIRRDPSNTARTRPTWSIKAAYQFPQDRHFHAFDEHRNLSQVVEIEISLNDVVCETHTASLGPSAGARITVCTLEDIIAEKLRALLQQPIRKRHRRQDLYDIARLFSTLRDRLDLAKISDYLKRKCAARDIIPTRAMFNEDIRARASLEYESLFDQHDPNFIAPDTAWRTLLELVGRLDLPDT